MNFLFVVSKYFPFGGMQRDLLAIANGVLARHHQVTVLTGKWEGAVPDNIDVIVKPPKALTNDGRNLELSNNLQRVKAQNHYDCVVGFTKMDGLDVYYAADPCFATKLAGKPWWDRWLPRNRRYLAMERAVFEPGKKTRLLFIARQQVAIFKKFYGTEPERFVCLPPGIDRQRLIEADKGPGDRRALREELDIAAYQRVILNIGSAFQTKGIDRLIRAVAQLPLAVRSEVVVVVVGDDDPSDYRALAKRLGIAERVIFTGGRVDAPRFYYIAELLAHPAYTENTGTTLLEAIVCGVPVLASGVCGYADYLNDSGAGMVTPEPFEQQKFNQQLQTMLSDADLAEMARAGRAYATNHDLYGMVDKAVDVIEQIARQPRL